MAAPEAYGSPRLETELELQLPAYATATATAVQDLSRVFDLHQSTWRRRILNPLSKARYQTHILAMSYVRFLTHLATMGTPKLMFR